jgi:hypothetical protein
MHFDIFSKKAKRLESIYQKAKSDELAIKRRLSVQIDEKLATVMARLYTNID